jgi:ankyrin repeat protein
MNGGSTPVYIAARRGHLEVVGALAALGADVTIGKGNGTTPVGTAAQEGHLEIVKELVALGG